MVQLSHPYMTAGKDGKRALKKVYERGECLSPQGRWRPQRSSFRVSGKRLEETSSGHNPLQTLKVKTVTKAKSHGKEWVS